MLVPELNDLEAPVLPPDEYGTSIVVQHLRVAEARELPGGLALSAHEEERAAGQAEGAGEAVVWFRYAGVPRGRDEEVHHPVHVPVGEGDVDAARGGARQEVRGHHLTGAEADFPSVLDVVVVNAVVSMQLVRVVEHHVCHAAIDSRDSRSDPPRPVHLEAVVVEGAAGGQAGAPRAAAVHEHGVHGACVAHEDVEEAVAVPVHHGGRGVPVPCLRGALQGMVPGLHVDLLPPRHERNARHKRGVAVGARVADEEDAALGVAHNEVRAAV
mmetsp:Transcript_65901/g.208569  ORF Transcript_65901/g.208569 Transcript_65901/m.208569 type:complete len:270 (-) Transcript_65901:262-1071(-)